MKKMYSSKKNCAQNRDDQSYAKFTSKNVEE